MARSKSFPAGPTKGRPSRSSLSPGCSPTTISTARNGPSPITDCVANAPIGHSRHAFVASRNLSIAAGVFIGNALQVCKPHHGFRVARGAPVASRGERASRADLGPVRHAGALELAGLEEPIQEGPQMLADLGQ